MGSLETTSQEGEQRNEHWSASGGGRERTQGAPELSRGRGAELALWSSGVTHRDQQCKSDRESLRRRALSRRGHGEGSEAAGRGGKQAEQRLRGHSRLRWVKRL